MSGTLIETAAARRRVRRRKQPSGGPGLRDREPVVRFAFYGRMSTNDFQDVATSLGWQREMAAATIEGRGVIVAEYFDAGCSRELAWCDRPAASALLAEATGSGRRFDAVVVGEYERAFCGDQFAAVMADLSGGWCRGVVAGGRWSGAAE